MNQDRAISLDRPSPPGSAEDVLGHRLAARLNAPAATLPHEVTERLRASRTRAVAARKRTPLSLHVRQPSATRAAEVATLGWLTRLGSVMPILVLALGMFALHNISDESRANEVAEVDSALLLDALPPGAYSDAGFAQYLRLESDAAE